MDQQYFPGQQSDEKVLYEIRPHVYALHASLVKLYLFSLVLFVVFAFLARLSSILFLLGTILAGAIAVLGSWATIAIFKKSVSYLTDRRIVRFEAATPFAMNVRALGWDDVVKTKTFPRNVFWKMLMIGTVIIHAKSTYVHTHEQTRENVYTNDDLDLEHVYYYRDLGNYIDKILYLYKHNPADLQAMRPFVPKPRGQRY